LGLDSNDNFKSKFLEVQGEILLHKIIKVFSGENHTICVSSNNVLFGCGKNNKG